MPGASRRGRRKSRRPRSDGLRAALTWIGPSYLVFLAIMAFPAVWNVAISFFSVSYGSDKFIGWSNYAHIFQSSQFYSSLWLSIYWTAGVFVGQFLLGLLLALFFNRQLWVGKFLKPLMIIPWAVPGIVAATAWSFMYSQDGLVDQDIEAVVRRGAGLVGFSHVGHAGGDRSRDLEGSPFLFPDDIGRVAVDPERARRSCAG